MMNKMLRRNKFFKEGASITCGNSKLGMLIGGFSERLKLTNHAFEIRACLHCCSIPFKDNRGYNFKRLNRAQNTECKNERFKNSISVTYMDLRQRAPANFSYKYFLNWKIFSIGVDDFQKCPLKKLLKI